MRVAQDPAFVLHARDYRETSLLLEVFTRGHGRIGLIAKGAKRPKSPVRGLLRPFQPLRLDWSGKGELATVTGAEATAPAAALSGEGLLCAYYLNELLIRLLHRFEAHERLYDAYEGALETLCGTPARAPEATLRVFEKRLLQELGYALVLDREPGNGRPVVAEARYRYVLQRGPVPETEADEPGVSIAGASLLALAAEDLSDAGSLREVKSLMRTVLDAQLDGRPLRTRALFQQWRKRGVSRKTGHKA